MSLRRKNRPRQPNSADLEITPFMNLMIVLVPVLLLNMVFTHISVLDIQLPQLNEEQIDFGEDKTVELLIEANQLTLYYPQGNPLFHLKSNLPQSAPVILGNDTTNGSNNDHYDYDSLQKQLRALKRSLQQHDIDKSEILFRIAPDIPYQTIVSTMDHVRSYKAVVAGSVVDAELFPDISFGDATGDDLTSHQSNTQSNIVQSNSPDTNAPSSDNHRNLIASHASEQISDLSKTSKEVIQ